MIASPLLASFVSTSTTPVLATKTTVFPPAPGITYRLSRTFLIVPVGGILGRCCAATPATVRPTTTIAARSRTRVIALPPPKAYPCLPDAESRPGLGGPVSSVRCAPPDRGAILRPAASGGYERGTRHGWLATAAIMT